FLKDNLKVVLGQHDRCIPNSDTVQFSLAEIIVHGDFDPRDFRHDVALLRLNMRVTNNKIISPICLPNLDVYGRKVVDKYKRRSGKIVGWGSTIANDESSISCRPLQVSVPILERSFCIGNDASLFCAGYVNGTADSCQGDSGGPLQIINRFKRYEIIGIISSGRGCAEIGEPGLYTDVLQKLNWIYERISDSSCLPYLPF
ncbi:PREDICTED: proclotting enzyme-like, partial [Nicrophorus vespilloides]|uniref:Proclotting enzyme-like n=1 Tax=Nicrophorus vespilloides TaxID=110193 RepID=A0ABM1M7N2_NICVS